VTKQPDRVYTLGLKQDIGIWPLAQFYCKEFYLVNHRLGLENPVSLFSGENTEDREE
jgi:hypothetical protein